MSKPNDNRRREQQQLLDALFIDEPTAEVCRQVDALLQVDEEFRQQYIETLQLRADLEWDSVTLPQPAMSAEQKRLKITTHVSQFFTQPTPLSMTIAALVMGLLMTVMAFMVPPFYRAWTNRGEPSGHPSYEIVAQVTATHDAVWEKGELTAYKNAYLVAGRRLELAHGLVEVTFHKGAIVILEGPAAFEIVNEAEAELIRGRIAARISKPARGFTVQTPQASIVDLGTEFGVEVQSGDATNVRVFQGLVEVALPENDAKQTLRAGEELTIDATGAGLKHVASQKHRFIRGIPRSAYRTTIAASRPLAWWPLDDAGGKTARDLSASGRHGSYVGNVARADESVPNLGRAARFGGAGYVDVASFPDLSASQALSVEAWIRYPAAVPGSWERIIEKDFTSGFVMTVNPAIAPQFKLTPQHAMFGINKVFAETPIKVADDRWHHIVGVWDGSTLRVYADGEAGSPVDYAATIGASAQPLRIGANSHAPHYERFQGSIDEVAIYDRALSADEIRSHYLTASESEFANPTSVDDL